MKHYLKFKKWVEQKKRQRIFKKSILVEVFVILIILVVLSTSDNALSHILGISNQVEPTLIPTMQIPNESPTDVPTSQQIEPVYVDPDPIVNCGPGQNSKQYVKDRSSNCKNYVDCGFSNNTVYVMMLNSECNKKHAEENSQNANNYPPCTVYYKYSGYSKTYNYMSPADCSYWQERASISTQPLSIPGITAAPLPTVVPYQYSQEYLDSLKNANNTFNQQWQPTPFVAPTQKCYATWDEYFNAHPNYAPQNIQGMSGTPPCD